MTCFNKRCGEELAGPHMFCPACSFLGRRAFAFGMFIGGALMTMAQAWIG